jgi:hypothetical protein
MFPKCWTGGMTGEIRERLGRDQGRDERRNKNATPSFITLYIFRRER